MVGPRLRITRFASNIRWQFVANGSQALLGGAYIVAVGRFLGPAEFGAFSAVLALVSVVGLLFEMRLQEVVARDYCHIDDEIPSRVPEAHQIVDLFVLEALSRLLPVLAIFILSDWLTQSIRLHAEANHALALAALGFLFSKIGSSVSSGMLRVLGRTDLIACCVAADWGLRLVLSCAVALTWYLDISVALWVAILVGTLCNGVQVWLACREFKKRIEPLAINGWRPREAWARLSGARRLIASNLGVSCSDLMAKDLDVALISGVLSAEKVGTYKMAKSFVQVLWRAIDPFYISIMPEVQKLWQSGATASLVKLLRQTSLRMFLLAVLLVAIGNILVNIFGSVLLGPGYANIHELMVPMSVWIIVCAPLIWGIPLAVAINRPELSVGGSLLGLIVGLLAFRILTPTFGAVGAAMAWNMALVTSFVFTTGIATWLAQALVSSGNRPDLK